MFTFLSGKKSRIHTTRRQKTVRPLLEALEARTLLSGFIDNFEGATLNSFWTTRQNSGSITFPSTAVVHGGHQSVQFNTTANTGQKNVELDHSFAAPTFGSVSLWMYDTGAGVTSANYMGFAVLNKELNVDASIGTQDYDFGPSNGGTYTFGVFGGSTQASSIVRTQGWHQFTIDSEMTSLTLSIDGTTIYAGPGGTPFDYFWMYLGGPTWRPAWTTYFDDFEFTAPATITSATGQDVSAAEGQAFTGAVASFTTDNPGATSGNFTASIDWGDGNVSSGTVTANGSGGFDVMGTNTYLEEGTYAISVTITGVGGSTATTGSTATIDDAVLNATAASVSAAEGTEFSGVVASFSDADPNAMSSDFTATINWGDGNVSDGLITANDSGGFDIIGTNTYAEEGNYPVSVSIADVGGSTASASGMATVGDAPLSATPVPVNATEGAAFTGPVATFTDANAFSDINDLSATITWGDGHTSAGTLAAIGPNTYTVSGTNTYAEEGSYLVSVQIKDQGGSVAGGSSTATVADAALTATFKKFSPIEGTRFTGVVATFRDADPKGTLSDYSATITWADGHTSAGKITPTTGRGFNVTGTTTYGEEGTYAVSVTIQDAGGSTTNVGGAIKVVDAGLVVVQAYSVTAIAGQPVTARLATFRDIDPNGTVGDYTASINWGDGHKSQGTISVNSTGGFDVTGVNTYVRAGTYTIKVFISDTGGSNVNIRTTATVGAAMAPLLIPVISGTRAFDSNQTGLAAVLAQWSSQNRIANLLGTGTGVSFVNRLNGNYFLQPGVTVFDDGAQDRLTGSAGQDWFFANIFGPGVLDKITGLAKDEIVTDI